MQVYIEYVIIDNLIFNFIILYFALKTSGIEIKKWRILLSSITGTIVAVMFPFVKVHKFYLFLLKILLGIIMILESGKMEGIKIFFKTFNCFLIYTFLSGGIIYGVLSLIGIDYNFLICSTNAIVPLGVMLIFALIIFVLIYRSVIYLFERKIVAPFQRECKIFSNGEVIVTKGFIDSGNMLIYKGDSPICIAGQKLTKKMMLSGFLNDKSVGEMVVETINGKGKIKIYQIDKIEIYCGKKLNIIYKPKIGITVENCPLSEDYQLILSALYDIQN